MAFMERFLFRFSMNFRAWNAIASVCNVYWHPTLQIHSDISSYRVFKFQCLSENINPLHAKSTTKQPRRSKVARSFNAGFMLWCLERTKWSLKSSLQKAFFSLFFFTFHKSKSQRLDLPYYLISLIYICWLKKNGCYRDFRSSSSTIVSLNVQNLTLFASKCCRLMISKCQM